MRLRVALSGRCRRSLMIIAGNITPIDVITHLPVLCEDSDVPYVYVPKKEDLGALPRSLSRCSNDTCVQALLVPPSGRRAACWC